MTDDVFLDIRVGEIFLDQARAVRAAFLVEIEHDTPTFGRRFRDVALELEKAFLEPRGPFRGDGAEILALAGFVGRQTGCLQRQDRENPEYRVEARKQGELRQKIHGDAFDVIVRLLESGIFILVSSTEAGSFYPGLVRRQTERARFSFSADCACRTCAQ